MRSCHTTWAPHPVRDAMLDQRLRLLLAAVDCSEAAPVAMLLLL
jgi:hypothetical protein